MKRAVEPDELMPQARRRPAGVHHAAPGYLPAIGEDREKLTEWLPDRWKQREAKRERAAAVGGDC
jgi:hypothetical protein